MFRFLLYIMRKLDTLYTGLLCAHDDLSRNTDNPFYTDTLYNDTIRYNDNFTVTKPSLKG